MSDDRSDLEEAVRLLRLWARWHYAPYIEAETRDFLARHPEKPKLLGCPWCGGEPELATPKLHSAMRRWYCHNCQVYGPWGTGERDAAAAWNRRAPASRFESVDGVQSIDIKIAATPASGPLSGGKPE